MKVKIDVRTARAEDKAAVVEFCGNTFSWGDYISQVWDSWLADGGFGFLFASDDEDEGTLRLNALAGDDGAMRSIAASARTEAGYRGYSGVQAMLVDQPAVNAALTSAGYRREGGILIYEQPL